MEVTKREIRLYPNRRLYDTGDARYITHADLLELWRECADVVVRDSAMGVEITL